MNTFLLLSLSLFSCGSAVTSTSLDSKDAFITGNYPAAAGNTIYFEKVIPNGAERIDSAVVGNKGEFFIMKKAKEMNYYRLRFNDKKNNKIESLFLLTDSSEKINLQVKGASFTDNTVIKGSKESARLANLIVRVNSLQKSGDSLNVIYNNASDLDKNQLAPRFNEIIAKKNEGLQNYVRKVIDEDPTSLVALEAVGRLDNVQDRAYFKKVADGLAKAHPKNPFAANFVASINVPGQISIGDEAPELALPDPEGKIFKLSSLRGKYVLIDFWASWCRPCRMENPVVVAAYQKYKDKGFTVLGVSLDRDKTSWTNAIAQDNLTWPHISDLQFWQSEAAKLYGVSSIPKCFLLDKEGKIIAMDLRGPALEATLSQILK